MNLKQAHEHLSHDARYRRHYDEQGDAVALAMHVSAVRRELGLSQVELAKEAGINAYQLSRLENLEGRVQPWVISAVVLRFQKQLRERGVEVDRWIARDRPTAQDRGPDGENKSDQSSGNIANAAKRPSLSREAMCRARGGHLLSDGERPRTREAEESQP